MSFGIDPSAQEQLLNWVNNVGKLPEDSARFRDGGRQNKTVPRKSSECVSPPPTFP